MTVSVSYNNQNNSPALNTVDPTLINSTAAGQVPEGVYFAYLSPEGLMSYIEAQLQSLDDKIFNHMKEVEGRRKAADALSEVSAILKQCEKSAEGKYLSDLKYKAFGSAELYVKDGTGKLMPSGNWHSNSPGGIDLLKADQAKCPGSEIKVTKPADPEAKQQYDAVVSQFYNAAEKLKAEGYTDLANKCEKLAKDLEAGLDVSADTIAGLVTQVESTMSSLSSASEMTMIRLQELMQQRSRTIMFVTNSMALVGQASNKIVENIR